MTRKGSATGTRTGGDEVPPAPEGEETPTQDLPSMDEIKSLLQEVVTPLAEQLANLDQRLKTQELVKARKAGDPKGGGKLAQRKGERSGGKKPAREEDSRKAPGTSPQLPGGRFSNAWQRT